MAGKAENEKIILGIYPGTNLRGYGVLRVAGNKATKRPAGIPMETPSGIKAAVVAEGLRITAEKQKSTTPKSIGVDCAMSVKSSTKRGL